MLVLSRRVHDKVVLPTLNVTVHVVAVKSGSVRLGFEAPRDVPVLRHEVQERAAQWQDPAAVDVPSPERAVVQSASVGLGLALLQLQAGQYEAAALTLEQLQLSFQPLLGPAHEKPAETARPALPRKALIVEDDPDARELLAQILRNSGIEVDVVEDGDDALAYLHTHRRPDVVLLDMGLPRCDGPTTVREIRRDPNYAGLAIFAVTGRVREDFDLAEGPSGIDRWFRKPLDPAVLLHDVRQLPASNFPGI